MSLLKVGESVGRRYRVEAEVGKGGMQEVYKALDTILDRTVALKVPQDDRVARKFRQSAVLAAKVNHPNVAKTLDYFEDAGGRFYLVEEFVPGEDLRQLCARFERLDPHAVAYVLHHLARALTASHRAGVVHRDLKPSNIMVVQGLALRGIKVTDFGIAKMAEHEVGEAISGGNDTTRRSTTMMGALAYTAPEVVESPHDALKASDVWAIAAIAWELLAGTPPFGAGLQALRQVILGGDPVLASAIANHPQFGSLAKELATLIVSCFDRDPRTRLTAEVLAQKCDALCYLPPVREVGTVTNYPRDSWGFIAAQGDQVFFHTKSLIGEKKPPIGSSVWFTRFEGAPKPRAIPVLPLKG